MYIARKITGKNTCNGWIVLGVINSGVNVHSSQLHCKGIILHKEEEIDLFSLHLLINVPIHQSSNLLLHYLGHKGAMVFFHSIIIN